MKSHLSEQGITIDVPSKGIVEYKEAIIMALLGVLRWREEDTVLSSVTGSTRNSIGGALWMGSH
jgi:anhydro-N-acetylmuramic acid kinase